MNQPKKQIVILGAGFGGLHAAHVLGTLLKRSPLRNTHRLLLVDRHDYHTYTPTLYETATSHEEAGNRLALKEIVAFSIHQSVRQLPVEFVKTSVKRIDVERAQLSTDSGTIIPYDYLLLAPGSETNFFAIPGLQTYAHTLKSLTDALHLREELLLALADPGLKKPKIVIGGGGATGVELAGEIASWIRSLEKTADITLIEGAATVLCQLDSRIIKAATRRLESLGVALRTSERIKSVTADEVSLESGGTVGYDLLIWTGGIQPSALMRDISLLRDAKTSRILVGKELCCDPVSGPSAKPVFLIGDAARFVDEVCGPTPAVARAAINQASVAAYNIGELAKKTEGLIAEYTPRTFKASHYPYVIPVGGKYALAKIGPVVLYGFPAWLFKLAIEFRYLISILPFTRGAGLWWKGVRIFIKNERLG